MNRYYIAIEGIDGSGKSTTIKYLQSKYNNSIDLYQRTHKPGWIMPFMNNWFIKKCRPVQIPVYLFLAHYNYWDFLKHDHQNRIVLMDRCFLTNICYFFPSALNNKVLRKALTKLEPSIIPNKIYVLDVDPVEAWERDNHSKDLGWLTKTRNAYIQAEKLNEYEVEIIPQMADIDGPSLYISRTIDEKIKQ